MPQVPWTKRKHRTSDAPFPVDYTDRPVSSSSSRHPSQYEMGERTTGPENLQNNHQLDEITPVHELHHRRHESGMTENSFASTMDDASIRKGKHRAIEHGEVLLEEDESDGVRWEDANGQPSYAPASSRRGLRSRFGKNGRARSRSDLPTQERRTMWERFKRGLLGENSTTSRAVMPDGTPVNLKNLFAQDAKALVRLAKTADYRVIARRSLDRVWWKWYIILGIIIVLSVLVTVKHDAIIEWIKPGVHKLKSWPAGWMIPIAILIVLSFPPLVGHEILGICIGLVWDVGIGFVILAAGTFLGELATWFAFKGMCTGRAAKFESSNKYYAALTTLIREKSFLFVLVLRFSAIPGHITTALSASAGAHFFSYCMAAILTLPKQLSLVYVGTAFGSTNSTTHTISVITLFLTIIGTGVAAIYIYYQMRIYLICSGIVSASDTLVTDSEMAQVPTLNVLHDLEDKLTASGYPPPYRPRSGTILSGEAAPAYSTIQQQKNERRPFIHSNSSQYDNAAVTANRSGSHTPSRSRSMGNRAQDDIEVYMRQNRSVNQSSNHSHSDSAEAAPYRDEVDDAPKFETSSAGDSIHSRSLRGLTPSPGKVNAPRSSAYLALPGSAGAIASGSGTENRSRSATNASTASNVSLLGERLLLDLEMTTRKQPDDEVEVVRGTSSMDMWRPSSMTLSALGKQAEAKYEERRQQEKERPGMSGREIARDADEYALSRGGKRPDMNRVRGESSAALLGRPTDAE
ncbi:hypothetical protein QFC22_004813 [Naganishia vaughanmartiniae]|uniref:Uncharacterized protein n=1 Tax=Naganishia vaughanmartiniae TaxID=1424756 RepID=A0ACC2X0T3_9TREE|nr:hypothetical protein QFC22_004813 [Naganishia vaughanmartiniae]